MKKIIVMLMIAALALSTAALAETYKCDDLRFEYDATAFDITMDDHTDDEDLIILSGKNEAWGDTYVRIYLQELEDDERFPTLDDFVDMGDTVVTQGDWNGYNDVFMYSYETEDGATVSLFIAPVAGDDDGEIDDILTVEIGVCPIEDDETAMDRDDLISGILDSLIVDD